MKNLLATAYWADDAAKLARMAEATGREREVARFTGVFERVRQAFQAKFLRPNGRLTVETQTAYLLALAFDLLPREVRPRAIRRLVGLIRERDWHLNTGFIGIRLLNPVLTESGHTDVAYRLLLQEDYPSWLYPVKHGATTIWERWNGWTEQDGFFEPSMNSFNHYSLGSVGEWLFRHVAGIELDPQAPGFKRFFLRPRPDARLRFVQGSYRTMHGEIRSAWEWRAGRFVWTVRVPPNTGATAYVPSDPGTRVTEGRRSGERMEGAWVLGRQGRFLICELGAGVYEFRSALSEAP
jgi:alpha-L-rhamnosidase